MIDYMHPMVLLQTNICCERENISTSKRYLDEHQDRLKQLFEGTTLYKELKEKYILVELDYIDEDITEINVAFSDPGTRGLVAETLYFITQEIEEKLK